jgi:hypothetical protein
MSDSDETKNANSGESAQPVVNLWWLTLGLDADPIHNPPWWCLYKHQVPHLLIKSAAWIPPI